MLNLKAGDVIATLITHEEKAAARIKGAVPRIISHRRDFTDERESAAAIDGTNRDCVMQAIGSIQEPAIWRDDHFRGEVCPCKSRRQR